MGSKIEKIENLTFVLGIKVIAIYFAKNSGEFTGRQSLNIYIYIIRVTSLSISPRVRGQMVGGEIRPLDKI